MPEQISAELELEATKANQAHLQELQAVLEKHSREISDLRAAQTLTQQHSDDQNLKAELRYNEISGWYGDLKQLQARVEELSQQVLEQSKPASQPGQSENSQLKLLQEEYQKLQVWSQELNARLQKIQGHWVYRILGRFIR